MTTRVQDWTNTSTRSTLSGLNPFLCPNTPFLTLCTTCLVMPRAYAFKSLQVTRIFRLNEVPTHNPKIRYVGKNCSSRHLFGRLQLTWFFFSIILSYFGYNTFPSGYFQQILVVRRISGCKKRSDVASFSQIREIDPSLLVFKLVLVLAPPEHSHED